MIRKSFFTLALLLVTLIADAQIGTGQWKIHPNFNGNIINNCVDAGTRVYFVSNGSLFYYEKSTQSMHVFEARVDVNGLQVSQIYYNPEKGNLVVAYSDCNIDIIDSNGNIINIPAVKDVIMPKAKEINDINFGNNKTYVATSFGYVVIEDDTWDMVEVRNYEYPVNSVAIVGDYKVMSVSDQFYYCQANEQIEALRWFQQSPNTVGKGRIYPINDNKFFFTTASSFYEVTMSNDSEGKLSFSPVKIVDAIPKSVQQTPNGFVASRFYVVSGDVESYYDYYYTFDINGSNAKMHNDDEIYTSQENNNWWVLGSNGLAHIVNNVKGEYVAPNGISIGKRAYWSVYDPYQSRVLLSRTAENRVLEVWDATTNTEINSLTGSQWSNVTPANIGNYGGNYWLAVSPNEPNTYFYCSRKEGGVAKVQNDSIVVRYNSSNAPISARAGAIAFDSQGNLWVAQPYPGAPDAIAITPEKQALGSVVTSDFVTNDLGGACKNSDSAYKRMTFDIGAGDTKVYSAGGFDDLLVIWNNNADLSLNQYKVFSSFRDQDNKPFSTYAWVYIKADNDGMIWIGTVRGVISFDPRRAFDEDFHITVNKVTRNEGVDVNEYLLEGIQVNCIDCDGLNRKWIGTDDGGVYLVSADGSEIIKHFDVSNSVLPSNQIYSVCCNRATNSVLIVTPKGVVEYFNDMTPSAGDYSNVSAYPNPVQSTFTGYVTIKGLMENSTVVVVDATGKTVAMLTSTGGVAMWDACDAAGVPVKTGIYSVYAAQGSPRPNGKPLTKIAVIK